MKFLAGNQCSEALGGRAIALELREVKGDRAAESRQKTGIDISTGSESSDISIEQIIKQIESLLLQTWQSTGFGSLTIESDRKNQKIQVIIKGGTHYRYVISDEDVVRRRAKKLPQGE